MPFEYAASFPREAKKSLGSRKSTYCKALGLLEDLSSIEIKSKSVINLAEDSGYEYSIFVPEFLKDKVREKIKDMGEVVEKFEEFLSHETEFNERNEALNGDKEWEWEIRDYFTGKQIAFLPQHLSAQFKRYLDYRTCI